MKKTLSVLLTLFLILQSFVFVVAEGETRKWLTLDSISLKTGKYTLVSEDGKTVTADNFSGTSVSIGESGWFTFDSNGDITGIELIPYNGLRFGYLVQIISGSYTSGAEYLRLVIYADKMKHIDISEPLKLNGTDTSIDKVYTTLSDYKGVVAYKYDSDTNKITELYTLDTPTQSLTDVTVNPETGSFDGLNYPITDDTSLMIINGNSYSSVKLSNDRIYDISIYGYDKNYGAKLGIITKISYTDVLFYKGEIINASENYITLYDSNEKVQYLKLANICNLNGIEYSDISSLYSAFGGFEGLVSISSDESGSINSIETLTKGEAVYNLTYSKADNTIGEYSLSDLTVFNQKNIYRSGDNMYGTVCKWNSLGVLNEDYIYHGNLYETSLGQILWLNDKTPVYGYIPEANAGISYDEENKVFSSFININLNGCEEDITFIAAAYKNNTLVNSNSINTLSMEEDAVLNIYTELADGSSLKDYTFKYFMFDKNLKTLETFPIFTGEDAEANDEQEAIKISGIITGNVTTNIDFSKTINTSVPAETEIKITDTYGSKHPAFTDITSEGVYMRFLEGESGAGKYLGKRVDLYLTEDTETGDFTILSCIENPENIITEFNISQYDSFSNNILKYYKEETDRNATSLKIEDYASVVYNNVGGYRTDDILGDLLSGISSLSGKVTLIDNDFVNGYDVIFVEVGITAVVDEVANSRVTFKESALLPNGGAISSITVNESYTDELFVFYKGGKEISVSDLKEWDAITIIAEKKNADYITCHVVENTVKGTVSSMTASYTSDTGYAYRIGESSYDAAFASYCTYTLQIGDTGLFYIDRYGKLAAFKDTSDEFAKYGFVLYAAYETGGVSDNIYQIKMITDEGCKIYDVAGKLNYYEAGNGYRVTVSSDNFFETYDFLGKNQFSLIKYNVNANDEISTIYEADYDYDKFATVSVNQSGSYDAANLSIGNRIIDEDATVFMIGTTPTYDIPTLDIYGYVTNDVITLGSINYKINPSESFVGTLADLVDSAYYTYMSYLTSTGDDANLLVITSGYGAISNDSSIAVINSVSTNMNDDGDDILTISYYQDGELLEDVNTTNDVYNMAYSLSEGDIVKIKTKSDGVIMSLSTLVDFGDDIRFADGSIDVNSAKVGTNGKQNTIFGMASAFTKSTRTATINGTSYRLSSASNIYVIDSTLKVGKVDLGSAGDYEWNGNGVSDVDEYADWLFVRTYDGRVEDVVIIKSIWEDPEEEASKNLLENAEARATDAECNFDMAYENFEIVQSEYNSSKDLDALKAAFSELENYYYILIEACEYVNFLGGYYSIESAEYRYQNAKNFVEVAEYSGGSSSGGGGSSSGTTYAEEVTVS